MKRKRFSRQTLLAIYRDKILRIRAGARSRHRFIGIWAVVVSGRVFARSWTQHPEGWYCTLLRDPFGAIQLGKRRISFRAAPARGKRLSDAVEDAYAAKYSTPGSLMFVRGFRSRRRRETTIELLPR